MIDMKWVYDKKNKTPEGTYNSLLAEFQNFSGYVILYFQAANSKNPEKGKCWCLDCNANAETLEKITKDTYSGIELWRVVASWRRRDWLDENDQPLLKNPFRNPEKLWRVPGLPHAQLVKNETCLVSPAVLQKACNPNYESLQHLLSRKQFMKFNL